MHTFIILVLAQIALMIIPSSAQNPNFAPGDLVLYFQQEGGSNTVYANLGDTALLYRGTAAGPGASNRINFLEISAALTTAFGVGWANDDKVYAGLAGVWGTSGSNKVSLQNGDPHRTIYVSASRASVGVIGQANSAGYVLNTDTGTINCTNRMTSQNFVFESNYQDSVVVSPTSVSRIDDQNPFLAPGLQDAAFNTFGGGVQQGGVSSAFGTFGAAGPVKFALDLYRILAITTAPGQVAGTLRVGSYEGTVTVNSAGMISFVSQGETTPFQSWTLSFPLLDTATKQLPEADPDNDGLTNLMEFILNGDPQIYDNASIAPKLSTTPTHFNFTFNRKIDSEVSTTLIFQYSSDLINWTDAAVGAASGVNSGATITVMKTIGVPDAISISIPKSVTATGKLFGRLKATL